MRFSLPREIDGALAAALAGVAFGNLRQRPVGIELGGIVAERDRQRGDGVGVMHEAVELGALGARLLHGVADHDEAGRQNLEVVAGAPGLLRAALHVGVERAPHREAGLRGEDGLRGLGRELAPRLGRAGLHDDRPALDRPRDVERTVHGEKFALVVEHMQLVGIEKDAVLDVADEGVIRPAVPQSRHHVVELARAAIALAVLHVIGRARNSTPRPDWRW